MSKVDLNAERELRQKEQMQKYISSAIYEIRNELNGSRKPYKGGKKGANQNTRGGMNKGRGGKPGTSQDRKNSKDERSKS